MRKLSEMQARFRKVDGGEEVLDLPEGWNHKYLKKLSIFHKLDLFLEQTSTANISATVKAFQ